MIDINTYRSRIGLFSPKLRHNKFLTKREYYSNFCENEDQSGRIALSIIKCILKIVLIFGLLHSPALDSTANQIEGSSGSVQALAWYCLPTIACSGSLGGYGQYWSAGWVSSKVESERG
jgi:hypothetical protein